MKIEYAVIAIEHFWTKSDDERVIRENEISAFDTLEEAESFLEKFLRNLQFLQSLSNEENKKHGAYNRAVQNKKSKEEINTLYEQYEATCSARLDLETFIRDEFGYFRPEYRQEFRIIKRYIHTA